MKGQGLVKKNNWQIPLLVVLLLTLSVVYVLGDAPQRMGKNFVVVAREEVELLRLPIKGQSYLGQDFSIWHQGEVHDLTVEVGAGSAKLLQKDSAYSAKGRSSEVLEIREKDDVAFHDRYKLKMYFE